MPQNALLKAEGYRPRAEALVKQARESFDAYREYVKKHIPNTSATYRAVMTRLEYRAKKIETEISEYEMLVRMNAERTHKSDQAFYCFLGRFMRILPQQQMMVAHDISTTALLVKPELEAHELIFDSKSSPSTVVVRETRTYHGSILGMIIKAKNDMHVNASRVIPAGMHFFVSFHHSDTYHTRPFQYLGTFAEVKQQLRQDASKMLASVIDVNATTIERMGKLNPGGKDDIDDPCSAL